jgi:hypothetical protein
MIWICGDPSVVLQAAPFQPPCHPRVRAWIEHDAQKQLSSCQFSSRLFAPTVISLSHDLAKPKLQCVRSQTVAIAQKQFSSRGQRIVQPTEATKKKSIDDAEENIFYQGDYVQSPFLGHVV